MIEMQTRQNKGPQSKKWSQVNLQYTCIHMFFLCKTGVWPLCQRDYHHAGWSQHLLLSNIIWDSYTLPDWLNKQPWVSWTLYFPGLWNLDFTKRPWQFLNFAWRMILNVYNVRCEYIWHIFMHYENVLWELREINARF